MPMPMPVAPEPAPAAAGGGHSIEDKTVLYAFREVDSGKGYLTPQFYLGEFVVTQVQPDSVTLAPLTPLSPDQAQQVTAGNATWTLYETCPIDTHEIFAGLTAEEIQSFIPAAETGLPPDEYAKLINAYVQDGQRAPDGTDPDSLWAEVKFKKTHKEEVDAAVVPENNLAGAELFDKDGKALPIRLHRKEADITEFESGDTAIIPNERALELVAQDVAEIVQPIYRRRLINYAARFTSIYRRKLEIDSNMQTLTRNIATLTKTKTEAEKQITLETELKRQLDEDLSKVIFERDGVVGYGRSLFSKLTETNNEIRNLYASNKTLNQELQQLTARATAEANRRTEAAVKAE